MLAVLVLAAILSLVAPLAVRGYLGGEYARMPAVTWLLMPGAIALSGSKVLANELTARGYPGINTIISALGAVTILVLDVLLIPRLGIVGAAAASASGYVASFVLTLWAFHVRSGSALVLVLAGRRRSAEP
jgi:O-antigen/teichoic acid export membrane protein